jgi:alkylation response protein AidB-like acyl-CoA dehydrogenase
VDFAFSTEQEELRRTVRQFLAARSAEADVRRLMETDDGYDEGVWVTLSEQLGLTGLAIPEEYGGSGFGFLDLFVVLEEMGRALLCAPFLSSAVLAAQALLLSDDDVVCKELLPGIAAGSVIGTLAVTESGGRWQPDTITTTARRTDAGWTVDGVKDFVPDGHVADLIVVAARTESGLSLLAVDPTAGGVERELLPTLDRTRKLTRLSFSAAPARLIGVEGEAGPVLDRLLDLACVALSAEAVGGASRCLEMAVEYAKVRVQFGRPIGSFQAIKHKCADLLVELESAKSAAYYAGWCADELNDELPAMASMAKALCSEVYSRTAADNIQIHGGIGFTWEHPAHLYLKRAKSSELLFGDPTTHRARLADQLGI